LSDWFSDVFVARSGKVSIAKVIERRAVSEEILSEPILVEEPDHLEDLAHILGDEAVIGVDTESNSLHAYQEQVCLIQFSTPEEDYLVDPLALEDLSPLALIFADPEVEKVFHAAEYDLICLKRDFGFAFSNLFDTMVAAQTVGRRRIGLGSMLEDSFGVRLNKRYQRANWGQRPLPSHLLAYARLDTHYLIPLRDRLKVELDDMDRWPLAAEEFARACKVEVRDFNAHTDDVWRISGAYDLNPQQAAVLKELCLYRDRMARSMDRPIFKVIPDQTLLAIAETCPRDSGQLSQLHGMTKGQMRRHGSALLAAVERGLKAPPLRPPPPPQPDNSYLFRLESLRTWRKHTARSIGVDSNVILPRDILDEIAESDPSQLSELAVIMEDLPWRLARYGDDILATLSDGQIPQ
jgi:ribonuclease D